jgi:hypothetical protein
MSRKTRIAILAAVGGLLSWALLSVVLLLYGNDWWLSGLTTLTVLVWLAGLLVVMYQQGPIRAAATGAVIASAVYWMLTLGPWFSTNVGPTLLTSRLLAIAEPSLRGNVPQTQVLTWATPLSPPVYSTGSGGPYAGSGVVSGQVVYASPPPATLVAAPIPLTSSVFQQLGHWLFTWLVAGLGGCAAILMQIRSRQRKSPPPSEAHVPSPGAAL